MSLFQTNIADGIRFTFYETERFKSNYLSVNFLAPLQKETASEYALLADVIGCGTQKYPTIAALNDRLNYLYGTSLTCGSEKIGDIQCLSVAFDFLRNEYTPDATDVLSGVMQMLSQVLFSPLAENDAFLEKNVESEKQKRIAEIESLIGNKRAYASVRMVEEMCKDEPYALRAAGTVAGVKAVTAQSLYASYQKMLQSAQIEIFFLGHCDREALLFNLKDCFAKTQRKDICYPQTVAYAQKGPMHEVVEEIKAQQSSLVIGLRGIPNTADLKKYASACVMNEIFGGSPSSKLFLNVREKMSLCYTCRSNIIGQKGLMSVYAGIATENKEITQNAILEQLSLCQKGTFSDDDIVMAKQSLCNVYRALTDRPSSIERFYLNRILAQDGHEISDFISAINAVTRDEIIESATKVTADTVFFLEGVQDGKGGETDA